MATSRKRKVELPDAFVKNAERMKAGEIGPKKRAKKSPVKKAKVPNSGRKRGKK